MRLQAGGETLRTRMGRNSRGRRSSGEREARPSLQEPKYMAAFQDRYSDGGNEAKTTQR